MATYTWIKTADGLWTEAAAWSGGIVPLTTDDVVIAAGAGAAYTVTLFTNGPIHDVTVNDANATFLIGSHGADGHVTAHTITVAAGTLKLNPFSQLINATVDLTGGHVWFNGGLLSGDTIHGAITLDHNGDDLEFTNGLTLTGAGGTGHGSISLAASVGHAYLSSTSAETLANTDIAVPSATGVIGGSPTQALTLAASSSVTVSNNAELDFVNDVVNNASINASAGNVDVFGTLFTNGGTIAIGSGHTLFASGNNFSNTGLITTTGGTLSVGTNQFSSSGTLSLTNALFAVSQHNVSFGNIGAITGSGSKLYVAYGTFDLAGKTLDLGAGTAFSSLQTYAGAGVFKGGTIINHGSLTQDWFGELNGATWRGLLETPAAGSVYFINGVDVRAIGGAGRGHILVDGYNSSAHIEDNATIGNVVIDLGVNTNSSGNLVGNITNSATLAATGLVQSSGDSNSANYISNFATFTNSGIINASGAAPLHIQWLNTTGTLVDHGIINANGPLVLFEAGTFTGDGTVNIFNGSTVRMVRGTAQGETFNFAGHSGDIGATGTLQLDSAATFLGTISGFHSTDRITFNGHTVTLSSNVLDGAHQLHGTLDGATPLTLTFTGTYTGDTFAIASGALTTSHVACFLRGTHILTASGNRPVEALRIGDRVLTRSGARPIKWIGRRAYAARFVAANPHLQPIRIAAGALGPHTPTRDLLVSPLHALHFDTRIAGEVLIPAGLLRNAATITRDTTPADVHYFHIELDSHDILFAEGAPAESFTDCNSRAMFDNAAEFAALYPNDPGTPWHACAPRTEHGLAVEEVRHRLAIRAGLPAPAAPGPLRGNLDRIGPDTIEGWVQDRANPDLPVTIELIHAGEILATTTANRYRTDLEHAHIGDGRHGYVLPIPPGLTHFLLRRAADRTPLPGQPTPTTVAAPTPVAA